MENDKDIKEKQVLDGNPETNDNSDSIKLQWLELETRVNKCRDIGIESCSKAKYQVYQEVLDFERQHGERALTLAGDLLQEVKDEVKDIFDETATLIRGEKNEEAKLILQSIKLHLMNGTPENLTLLHVAAEAGNEEMTRHLIELGSDVEAKTSSGFTPLKLAVENKKTSVVEILLWKGKANYDGINALELVHQKDNDATKMSYMLFSKRAEDFAMSSEGKAFAEQRFKDYAYKSPKKSR